MKGILESSAPPGLRWELEYMPDEIHPPYLTFQYMKERNNNLAIVNYMKSLELDPGNANAENMLKIIKEK